MRILCACECSQVLTKTFIKSGFNAFSCDLSDSFGDYPERHYKCDVFKIVDDFDYVFAFPPCTHLTFANGLHLQEKLQDGRMFQGLEFVKRLFAQQNLKMLENPLGVIPKYLKRPYSQIVSPDDFGSKKKKRTCLWLFGLPLLIPTTCRAGVSWIQSIGSFDFRRSILDEHLAAAMVNQWGEYLK